MQPEDKAKIETIVGDLVQSEFPDFQAFYAVSREDFLEGNITPEQMENEDPETAEFQFAPAGLITDVSAFVVLITGMINLLIKLIELYKSFEVEKSREEIKIKTAALQKLLEMNGVKQGKIKDILAFLRAM